MLADAHVTLLPIGGALGAKLLHQALPATPSPAASTPQGAPKKQLLGSPQPHWEAPVVHFNWEAPALCRCAPQHQAPSAADACLPLTQRRQRPKPPPPPQPL